MVWNPCAEARKVFISESYSLLRSFAYFSMDTLHLVDVTDRPWPEFKRHPFKSEETDPVSALSSVPYGVLHVEDVRSFYHCKLEDMGVSFIYDQYRWLCDNKGILKEQFKSVAEKGFHHAGNFINDFDNELVRFVLSHIHDQFMWLDRVHKIVRQFK